MIKYILFYFTIFSIYAIGQPLFQVYNLDFEIGNTNSVPIGWRIDKEAKQMGYVFALNVKDAIQGENSAVLYNFSAKEEQSGSGFMSIDATPYRGKKVKLSGFFKTQGMNTKVEGELFIVQYLKDDNKMYSFDRSELDETIWSIKNCELEISPFAEKINFGFTLYGPGSIYADDIKLEIANTNTREDKEINTVSDDQLKKIKELGQLWANLRYFMPTDESQYINQEALLIELINSVFDEESLENIKNDLLKPVFPAYFMENYKKPQNSKYNEYYVYKHVGAPNFGTPGFSSSEVKNIYFTDRPREAVAFQKMNVQDFAGNDFTISCKVNCLAKNSTGQVQIWQKIDKTLGNDERITSFDNNVTDTKGEWKDYKITGKLPETAKELTIGLVGLGELNAYIDDVKLTIHKNNKDVELLVSNNSFEVSNSENIPSNWTIPTSVYGIGYKVESTNDKSYDGNSSLLIESDITRNYKYPEENKKVGEINMPSGLYMVDESTYPKGDQLPELSNFFRIEDDISKIALAIDAIAHSDLFFDTKTKYFKDQEKFNNVIRSFLSAETYLDLEYEITKIFDGINDAQFRTWNINDKVFSAPFNISKYADGYYISSRHPNEKEIQIGDRVLEINGENIEDYVNKYIDYQPSANKEYSINRALAFASIGNENEEITILLEDGKEITRKKKYLLENIYSQPEKDRFELKSGVFYIDPSNFNDKYFQEFFDKYGTSINTVILDARETMNITEFSLGFFTDSTILGNINKIPVYTSPDHRSYKTLQTEIGGSLWDREVQLIILIDENTTAYNEYIVSIADHYDLATLVGEPSSGSPGESAAVRLIGGFNYSKNIVEVFDPSGIKISGKPIEPDVYVTNSSKSINPEIDEVIEKALEIAK